MSRRTHLRKGRTVPRKGTPSVFTKGSGDFSVVRLQRDLATMRAQQREINQLDDDSTEAANA